MIRALFSHKHCYINFYLNFYLIVVYINLFLAVDIKRCSKICDSLYSAEMKIILNFHSKLRWKNLDLLQRNVSSCFHVPVDAWHLAKNVCSIDERVIRRTMHSSKIRQCIIQSVISLTLWISFNKSSKDSIQIDDNAYI